MLPFKIKIEWKKTTKRWTDVPTFGRKVFITAVVVSILFHLISFIRLQTLTHDPSNFLDGFNKRPPIRITMTEKKEEKDKKDDKESKGKILETPQLPTEKPKDSRYVGNQDHSTEKETRVKKENRTKALDPGQVGSKKQAPKVAQNPDKSAPDASKNKPTSPLNPDLKLSDNGTLGFSQTTKQKPRNKYEELLPSSENDLPGQINAGYQDLVDENAIVSERIDMNTTNYRYIGYFSGVRKQIELVWIYPMEAARRGIQGEVQVEVVLAKSGHVTRVRVIKSSGHSILDEWTLSTIKQASPFAPLPASMKKERLVFIASFHYQLTAYAGP